MNRFVSIAICALLFGCSKPPTKQDRIRQVQAAVAKAGGEEKILEEARILIKRMPKDAMRDRNDECFKGLVAIGYLGDVFRHEENRIEIRVYNSHSDVFHIAVLNPDDPVFADFESIVGKIGFINLASVNGSQANQR